MNVASPLSVQQGAGPQTITDAATNINPGPANEAGQSLNFLSTNNNTALFIVQPAMSSSGTLTFTPRATGAVTEQTTVTVRLQDGGGTANGGVDTSAPQTFVIIVLGESWRAVALCRTADTT